MSKDMEDVTQSGSADIEAEEDSSETHCLGEQKESSHGGGSQVDSSPTLCEDEQLPTEQHVRLINKDLILPPHFSSGVFVTQSDGEALPICTPPQLSRTDLTPVAHSSFPLCLSNGHGHEKKRLHSTSTQKSQHSLKSTASQIQQVAGNASSSRHLSETCASALLACLSCHILECLLLLPDGCYLCTKCLCSHCCCSHCSFLGQVGSCALCHMYHELCGCALPSNFLPCEACLHALDCLDLAMELSQLCYH
ncbi:uncharacterized protein LOC120543119 isoform X1 [Polypterus senegalus]|uniref:uncharacterized protein LOC120543119 isoform X1 n=1 Tax=Polypterus senegalus TaxID=55291 RepID=UPI001963156D|nr:uncharacterized protein LOC120543119 isoform X1 [Polypterus senegalus]